MKHVKISAFDCPDAWFKVLSQIWSQGDVFRVGFGSEETETKKLNLFAMNRNLKTQATASEVALAGKGFNKEVEASYRAKHGELSFAWVDKMLGIKIPAAQVEEFLKKGKLGEFRGAK